MTLSVVGLLAMPAVIAVTVARIMAVLVLIVLPLLPASSVVAVILHRSVVVAIGRFQRARPVAVSNVAKYSCRYDYQLS